MLASGLAVQPGFNYLPNLFNDNIRFGVIGCNGMGWSNMRAHLHMEDIICTAICDVDQNVVSRRVKDYAQMRPNQVKTYNDYRALLADKEVDAVIIGTPDHWHCKILCDALEAGKHVYVEKPLANSIHEAQVMQRAATAHPHLMIQVGQWQRSGPHYREAIDIVQSGVLGNIRLVKVWAYQGWMKPVDVVPDSPVPEGVDYNMWLGPARRRPFNANRFHFNFRWFWDYAGGLMTDWGVHEIDIALYAMKAEAPKSVVASGGKLAYPDDASETPDTLQAIFEYDNFNMLWDHATGIDSGPYGRREGVAFIGNNGTLVVDRQGYDVIEEREDFNYSQEGQAKMELIEEVKKPAELNYLVLHCRNFVNAIKEGDIKLLNTNIFSGSVAAVNAHMGNIAYKTGKRIYWNASKNEFNVKEASKMIRPVYHNGWRLPQY